MATPAIRPMATRPLGPIQPLSNAYFRKYAAPKSMATIPMRFSQTLPILPSRSPVLAGGVAMLAEADGKTGSGARKFGAAAADAGGGADTTGLATGGGATTAGSSPAFCSNR